MEKVKRYLNNKGFKTKMLRGNSLIVDIHNDIELAKDLVVVLKHQFKDIKCYANVLVEDEAFVVVEMN